MIRVDTIENSAIRRSIDIRKTMYNENIDCNYTGVVAVFAPTRFAKCILTSEYRGISQSDRGDACAGALYGVRVQATCERGPEYRVRFAER